MDFDPDDVRANRDFFAAKLRAYKEKAAVLKKVKDGLGHDFVLLDVRQRAAFRKAHVQGAWCTPLRGAHGVDAAAPARSGARHLLLERLLTPRRESGSAVGGAGVLREGYEHGLGRLGGSRPAGARRGGHRAERSSVHLLAPVRTRRAGHVAHPGCGAQPTFRDSRA